MSFVLDSRLAAEGEVLLETDGAIVLLRDEARWPWCVLVPKTTEIEFHRLGEPQRQSLMRLLTEVAAAVGGVQGVQKLNIAAFGNVVAQQHWHVIGRWSGDPLWPDSVIGQVRQPMHDEQRDQRRDQLAALLKAASAR